MDEIFKEAYLILPYSHNHNSSWPFSHNNTHNVHNSIGDKVTHSHALTIMTIIYSIKQIYYYDYY